MDRGRYVIFLLSICMRLQSYNCDFHIKVWGMGEDSIFNAELSSIRDDIVTAISAAENPKERKRAKVKRSKVYILTV